MVKNGWLLILLFGLSYFSTVMAEVRMTVKADKKTISLGEPLTMELRVEDVSEPISSINLDKLKQNFNIYNVSTAVEKLHRKGRVLNSETMTLTLYPLHAGKFQIPALNYLGKRSNTMQVAVLKPSEELMLKTDIDTTQSQVRQDFTLTLTIYDDGSLQWTVPRQVNAVGAHQRWLSESQNEEMLEGKRYTVHRYAWALMPLREGVLTIQFPLLDAFKFGQRLRYPVSPLRTEAAPVPAYLPVHVPIGKPLVTMEPLPAEIALNRPLSRLLKIQGKGLSIEGISKLLSSMRGNESLKFYPLEISTDDRLRPTSAMQTLLVNMPFVPLQSGKLQFPVITLPYYDPVLMRVESVSIPGITVEVFNPVWLLVKKVSLGLLVLLAVLVLSYALLKRIRLFVRRRKSILAISRAASAEELKVLLWNFANASIHFITLQQWLAHMQQVYAVDARLTEFVLKLERTLYGEGGGVEDVNVLTQEAVELLKNLRYRKVVWLKILRH